MMQTETRLRLLRLTFACAALAATLAGCGGGGGGSGDTTPPPRPPSPAPAPSESTYLLAEFVADDTNHQFVRVWDPAQPTVAVQNVQVVQSNGIVWTSSHLLFSDATAYDPGTHTRTTLGHARVFYDNDGKLYSIDLRGGHSHAPAQLSSAVDVFEPSSVTAMDAAGDDAWIDAQGGDHHWAIRSTMAAGDAPVSVLQIVAPLRDTSTGLPQYFLASLGSHSGMHVTPVTYEVVDTTFAAVSVPAVAAMVTTDGWVGADPAQAGLGYLRIASQLRELHWSAGAVSVDAANLHTFASNVDAASVADAQSLYVDDNGTLLALTNGGVRGVGTFTIEPTTLLDAGGYIAGLETNGGSLSQVFYQLETLRKSDGVLTLLEAPTASLQLLAASDQGLVLAGTPEQGQAFVVASGDNLTRTTLGAQYVGVVRAASGRVDQPAAPVALLSCVAGTTGYCISGALTQLSLTGASTALGLLAASAPIVHGDAIAGLATSLPGQTLLGTPGGFGDDETDFRDAWQFTPAVAGSLVRVTSNLP